MFGYLSLELIFFLTFQSQATLGQVSRSGQVTQHLNSLRSCRNHSGWDKYLKLSGFYITYTLYLHFVYLGICISLTSPLYINGKNRLPRMPIVDGSTHTHSNWYKLASRETDTSKLYFCYICFHYSKCIKHLSYLRLIYHNQDKLDYFRREGLHHTDNWF